MNNPVHSANTPIDQAVNVLVNAFFDDPFYRYVFPDASLRPRKMAFFMKILVLYGKRYGRVDVEKDPVLGAAIWLPPSAPMVTTPRMIRTGMLKAPFFMGRQAFRKMLEVTREWEALQAREPKRHWYLAAIGVEPKHQGKGIGGRLLSPVLEEADKEKVPCYLETMTRKDIAFYEKHGFRVAAEGRIDGEIPYWTMRRNPQ